MLHNASAWLNLTLAEMNDKKVLILRPVIILVGICIFISVVGNGLICYIFYRKMTKRAQHFLIVCLAVLDLISGTVVMPTEIVDMKQYYTFESEIACKMFRFFNASTDVSSILLLLAIAMDRYKSVLHPFHPQMTIRSARLLLLLAIFGSLLICWPSFILFGIRNVDVGIPGIRGKDCTTDDEFQGTAFPLIYNGFQFTGFTVISISLVVVYVRIFKETRRHFKYIKTTTDFNRLSGCVAPTHSKSSVSLISKSQTCLDNRYMKELGQKHWKSEQSVCGVNNDNAAYDFTEKCIKRPRKQLINSQIMLDCSQNNCITNVADVSLPNHHCVHICECYSSYPEDNCCQSFPRSPYLADTSLCPSRSPINASSQYVKTSRNAKINVISLGKNCLLQKGSALASADVLIGSNHQIPSASMRNECITKDSVKEKMPHAFKHSKHNNQGAYGQARTATCALLMLSVKGNEINGTAEINPIYHTCCANENYKSTTPVPFSSTTVSRNQHLPGRKNLDWNKNWNSLAEYSESFLCSTDKQNAQEDEYSQELPEMFCSQNQWCHTVGKHEVFEPVNSHITDPSYGDSKKAIMNLNAEKSPCNKIQATYLTFKSQRSKSSTFSTIEAKYKDPNFCSFASPMLKDSAIILQEHKNEQLVNEPAVTQLSATTEYTNIHMKNDSGSTINVSVRSNSNNCLALNDVVLSPSIFAAQGIPTHQQLPQQEIISFSKRTPQQSLNSDNTRTKHAGSNSPKVNHQSSVRKAGNYPKNSLTTTLIAVAATTVFIVSFLPHLCLMLARFLKPSLYDNMSDSGFILYNIFVRSYLANSVLNPIIYGCLNRKFRHQCYQILRKIVLLPLAFKCPYRIVQ